MLPRWRLTLRYCVEAPNIVLPDAADDRYLGPLYCLVGGTVTVLAAKQPLTVSGTCTHLNADNIRTLRWQGLLRHQVRPISLQSMYIYLKSSTWMLTAK